MYDRDVVDFNFIEHAQAEKLDGALEKTIKALDNGFQPLQDTAKIIGLGWAVADIVRTSARTFYEREKRTPLPAEISAMVLTYFLMLERDNRYTRTDGTAGAESPRHQPPS